MRMADSTIIVDIVDKSVPELNPKKIAIINQPNPAYGVTVTGRQLLHLIQFPQYWITESATGNVINGRNIFQYFPELDPDGGGSKKYTLISKAVYDNGIYKASDDNADGYRTMVVDVPSPILVEKTITADGVYNPSDDNADGYSKVIAEIPIGEKTVKFYDYDGSVVASYTKDEFLALTEMPSNPSHEGLTARGWNYNFADAKTYVTSNGSLNIGQMYITDDGKTRIYITLTEGRISPILQLYLNANSELDIDWGDGSTHSTFTSTSAGYKSERHNYATAGDYIIAITVTTGSFILQSSSASVSSILWNGNNSTSSPDRAYNNSIKKIENGTGVTSIGNNAFRYCYSLSSITIPDGVTSIGNNAFQYCYSLSSITIPDTVTSIGNSAFQYCYSLSSITIPDGVTSIGGGAFQYCYSLSSITIPDTVTSIGTQAFQNCYGLGSIKFTSTTPPTVSNSNAWSGVTTDCIIYVPAGSLNAYKSAANYPIPTVFTYVEY